MQLTNESFDRPLGLTAVEGCACDASTKAGLDHLFCACGCRPPALWT